ncbi:uncharacterized protein PAC_07843 [Phialocephala subalpina]|uniref:Heterokaryon incompatibility domain-containing protein n=1 Tax=Phialocephala subalpina TaxID=576137 RepID=A0A1L7WYV6_9HELO|nr:uncharacterized protein PAC_07843 [Phialocephala subalpina]
MSQPPKPFKILKDVLQIAESVRGTMRKVESLKCNVQEAATKVRDLSRLQLLQNAPSRGPAAPATKPLNPGTCDGCGNLTSLLYSTNGERLERGASLDCHSCALIRKGVAQYFELSPEIKFYLHSRERASLFAESDKRCIEFYTEEGYPNPVPAIKPARALSPSFSQENLQLLSQWLQNCVAEHPTCMQKSSALPTRVLSVGSSTQKPYLYETRGEEAWYVALSHCWGPPTHRPLTTTKTSLSSHMQSIPLSMMPQTFLDAILVTRKLGIEFIWIDSLCIVQDDAEDWAKEAARMSTVYQNAILTIAADGAKDSTCGLFEPVSKRLYPGSVPIGHSGDTDTSLVYAREIERDFLVRQITFPGQQRDLLHHRAWVLQEWLLSPRLVHFCVGELLWECHTVLQCECQVLPTSADTKRMHHEGFARSDFFPKVEKNEGQSDLDWRHVVHEFTKRQLTQERDRLPALSGIAVVTKVDAVEDYVCGHWKSDLPESLLWASYASESKRQEPYYTPTWSWASVTGKVSYGKSEGQKAKMRIMCEMLEVSTVLASTNPFGSLQSGFIKIKGHIGPLSVYPHLLKNRHQPWHISSEAFPRRAGRPLGGTVKADVMMPEFEFSASDELALLIVASLSEVEHSFEGLALRRARIQGDELVFERVGLATLNGRVADWDFWFSKYPQKVVKLV